MMKSMRMVVLAVLVIFSVGAALQEDGLILPEAPPALDLPLIQSELVPKTGNFYFAYETQESRQGYPPLPYNPMAALGFPVYAIGTNLYLVDNRQLSLAHFAEVQAAAQLLMSGAA